MRRQIMSKKVDWDYIAPVKMPADLKGIQPGKLPEHLLRPAVGGGKLHWLAAAAWAAMVEKAKADGIELKPVSAGDTYRTYDSQLTAFKQRYTKEPNGNSTRTFEGVKWYKKDPKLASLAAPGTSQHNSGLAVDVHTAAEPKRLKWLIDNVKTFGFSWEVVPEEPWHLRYCDGDTPSAAVKAYMDKNNIKAPEGKGSVAPIVENEDKSALQIKLGDKGDKVKQLQELLNKKGFACTADGNFGPSTQKALNYFKQSVNLKPNGICNDKTWDAITA